MNNNDDRGMATAEYVVGTVGATVIATLLCTCGMGDNTLLAVLLQSIFNHVTTVTDAIFNVDSWRWGAMM